MRLDEIIGDIDFNAKPTNVSYNRIRSQLYKRSKRSGTLAPLKGSGSYGTAYDQPHADVSHVLKIGHQLQDEEDAYMFYISKIIEMHNPYFPQISELKRFVNNKTGQPFFKVRLEKLSEFQTITPAEAQAMCSRMFGLAEYDFKKGTVTTSPYVWIAGEVELLIDEPKYRKVIVDPALLEAVEVISRIITLNDDRFGNDASHYNMMIRRTKYGPQLVITDPIFGR